MRKLFVIPFLFFSLTTMAACSEQDEPKPETEQPTTPDSPDNGKHSWFTSRRRDIRRPWPNVSSNLPGRTCAASRLPNRMP